METFEHRYSTVFFMAQHGPNNGAPFFGFVNLKTTWAEWEAKLHYRVAQFVAIELGCASEAIVCSDAEDMPAFFKQGIVALGSSEPLKAYGFAVERHHYEQARQSPVAMPSDNAAKESAGTRIMTGTRIYDYDTHTVVSSPRLPDALRQAAEVIEGLSERRTANVAVATEHVTDDHGQQVPIYGVQIDYDPGT